MPGNGVPGAAGGGGGDPGRSGGHPARASRPDYFAALADRRAIVDRRALSERLRAVVTGGPADSGVAARRQAAVAILGGALAEGRAVIAARLAADPARGLLAAQSYAYLTDQILRLLYDVTVEALYPNNNRTAGERIAMAAVGGYGRGEMAPFSDIDIAFLIPWRQTPWTEQVIESIIYSLWDLKLKVGQSVRALDEMVRIVRDDLTARTAFLEARFLWGDQALYDEAAHRFAAQVVAGSERDFVARKLEERDRRHERMGDSRYVVEPNVKDGKGGLRDLQTLFWIGKYVHHVKRATELADAGLFSPAEFRQFARAENFLWAVRCHLHLIAGRAEERIGFDLQREIARRMRFRDRPGRTAVERFMQYYFLNAKTVGDLTGIFLAHLDDQMAETGRRWLPQLFRRPGRLHGFVLDRGRLSIPRDRFFADDPLRLIELFHLADRFDLEIHPVAMRAARRDSRLIDARIRDDRRANALFLDLLTSTRHPEISLRWMNEAGVFGRFVPDFGKVVGQTQFDMYHHYTVDEHTIRAIGLLARIERGERADAYPLASALMGRLASRRTLYVAVLLHDIAKGRGGDHSVLGAEVALRLCPRFGLDAAETETVVWLVRHHLLMAHTAFKRDLSDPKTIQDFAHAVAGIGRLRLLLVLTVVDISAVGPATWNEWKRRLLTELFDATEERLRLGHMEHGRAARIAARKADLRAALAIDEETFARFAARFPESYWIAEPPAVLLANARLLRDAAAPGDGAEQSRTFAVACHNDPERGATLVQLYARDRPGLFHRAVSALAGAGVDIIDARIHTTEDGYALDNFLVQDWSGGPVGDDDRIARIEAALAAALAPADGAARDGDRIDGDHAPALIVGPAETRGARALHDMFSVAPAVDIDNDGSHRFTLIETTGRDRPALLAALAAALHDADVDIYSAHVATYGERAVDTFYVTLRGGAKLGQADSARVRALLLAALAA